MVFVNCVPLLNPQLLWTRASLCSEKLLQIANGVIWVALDTDLLAESIVADYFYHRSLQQASSALDAGTTERAGTRTEGDHTAPAALCRGSGARLSHTPYTHTHRALIN